MDIYELLLFVHILGAEHGADSPQALWRFRRLLFFARLDLLFLVTIVFLMVVKPTWDDVGVIVGLAGAVAAVAALLASRYVSAPAAAPAQAD